MFLFFKIYSGHGKPNSYCFTKYHMSPVLNHWYSYTWFYKFVKYFRERTKILQLLSLVSRRPATMSPATTGNDVLHGVDPINSSQSSRDKSKGESSRTEVKWYQEERLICPALTSKKQHDTEVWWQILFLYHQQRQPLPIKGTPFTLPPLSLFLSLFRVCDRTQVRL